MAQKSIRSTLLKSGTLSNIRIDAESELILAFKIAHEAIRTAFREKYVSLGCEVQDTEDGYLVKRQNASQPWTCTHGGTTGTVVLVIDGWRMIVANVGDSTALWGGIDAEGQTIYRESDGTDEDSK